MAVRQNKFARRVQERDKKNIVARDAQPTVDDQLGRLEEDIRRLKVEFDIYFNGGAKRPPYDTKSRVETVIKRLADDRTLTFAQRYRYNSLIARHTSFLQLWRRTMKDREEGRGTAASRVAARFGTAENESPKRTFVCADARREVSTIKSLYESFVDAKKQCGEPTEDLSFPRFHRMISEKSEALKERAGCERVQFSIDIRDGRVSFKAKADK